MTATSRITPGRPSTARRPPEPGSVDLLLAGPERHIDVCSSAPKVLGVQLTDSQDLFGWANQAVLGADYSDSDDTFSEAYQYGGLSPDRSLIYEPSPFNDETVISLAAATRSMGPI
jgi:hypothetical protein